MVFAQSFLVLNTEVYLFQSFLKFNDNAHYFEFRSNLPKNTLSMVLENVANVLFKS